MYRFIAPKALILSLVCFLAIFSIHAQNFELKGRVIDSESKNYLDGVSVTLRGTAYGKQSVAGGLFKFDDLPEDKYTLSLNLKGYNRYDRQVNLKEDLDLGDIVLVRIGAEGTVSALQKTIRSDNVLRLINERPNFQGGNMVFGIAPEPKKLEGNSYLDNKWNSASILLYRDQQMLEGFRVRYNITSNMFELMEPENNLVSILPGLRVQNVVWVDSTYRVPRYFVNGMDFLDEGSPVSGFFEVLVEGELPLLRRTLAVFKESSYNEALMIGERNDKIVKRDKYFYLRGKDLVEMPRKRKQFFPIFGDLAEEMEEFTKANNLNIKDPNDVFQIFTKYNSEFAGFKPIMNQLLETEK
ncbi:MAG: carboxypeptidase-like regulatory domain-containing protein [Bacteroidota bacterium]|uniref:CarboxypepD_reg-like domain-containing protein n=1 Tax=Algoriphagus faecimaris TaxID=686796 RepID=A0A1G6PGL5_9BACT|nr:carboxypeptidase-like regulatory domain-containing protein [Algoriphagus faecimaris]SDC79141.1 CarboxypepD_reg-like domain-containing protein [Algoriphagus faecimaris]